MRASKIHYTWIGEVKTTDLDHPGHDLVGPCAMMPLVDAEVLIYFWCLKEYKDQFSALLAGKNIVVLSINALLVDKKDNEYVARILALQSILFSDGRGDIRDRVTFKEVISLLILYLEGGYAFDTNVLPAYNEKMHFPSHPAFHMAAIDYPVKKNRDQDVWAMYSPQIDSRHVQSALERYLDCIEQIEYDREVAVRGKIFDYEQYKQNILDVIIEAASCRVGLQYWFARHLGGNFPVQLHLEHPKIIKYYANSHGAADRQTIPPFHLMVSKNDMSAVKELLKKDDNFDINFSIETEKYSGITALNVAVFYGYQAMAMLLIEQGADAGIVLQENRNQSALLTHSFLSPSSQTSDGDEAVLRTSFGITT
ncbi:MAG: hypothetical protein COY58_08825 [Gammaproteobacteria bacterium CG_4_10_14_0_8_um_filter_38_16]|nr:MAG: hypothetical protein COY58_08825 [Gammaproteobacteria bacterium CG_4_10_14_0_8_um_filter_38_16]PJA02929.1 MAG: hypothetical protein COX72_07850 [Gammaproteobacteria bacterium CG_4_10_14_0_2_um_filter_38_22]PJB11404.1 MAG: hypothetical protein CO120_00390 [Gammaproteobacteria bacterium CG_4_9_14_3_um_filter_38_9]